MATETSSASKPAPRVDRRFARQDDGSTHWEGGSVVTESECRLEFDPRSAPSPVVPALIWAEEIESPAPTETMPEILGDLLKRVQSMGEEFVPTEMRQRVRKMLRYGKYKPSGRGKPASEFLLRAALDGSFPMVNGPVDVNNIVSLESGLPGSIFDADLSGRRLLLRRGAPGESYVFNPSGQSIDLQDLLLTCRRTEGGWEPCGNPVKDSMATKIRPETRDVIAVLYAPADEPIDSIERWAGRYAELLDRLCGAVAVGFRVGLDVGTD
jgi:DNA/RNA-binding domain of Phe-tRNA-synthetase-like protein